MDYILIPFEGIRTDGAKSVYCPLTTVCTDTSDRESIEHCSLCPLFLAGMNSIGIEFCRHPWRWRSRGNHGLKLTLQSQPVSPLHSSCSLVEVLLYVHRNRRLIRAGSPGRPPRLTFTQMMMMSWCLMSSDVIWHIRDKLWPMPKHGSIKSTYVRCMRV